MSEAQESTPVVESSEQSSGDGGSAGPPPNESGVEATPQEAASSDPMGMEIENLLTAQIEDPIFSSEESYKGINYQEVVNGLPDDAKKIISKLRSSYTKKTQEIAEQQKIMRQHVEEIEAQRQALLHSDFYKGIQEEAGKEVKDLDPYNPKSFEARIQSEVAKRMQDMLKPMRHAHELQQRKFQLQAFKREHPDLEGMKKEVARVLMQNEHMNLEQAYWVVKGKKLQEESKNQEAELGRYKQAAKSAGLKVGGASRGNMRGVPQYVIDKDDPIAIYRWLESNKGKGKS